jgi:hypothetical protein
MAEHEKLGLRERRALPGGPAPRSPRRRLTRVLAGVALLLSVIVAASATACTSDDQVASDATTTTAAAQTGRLGPPTGGMPPAMRGDTAAAAATTSTTLVDTTTTTAAETTTTTLAEGSYGDGIYLVGTDIDSGLYKGTASGGTGHWEISTDANGERFVAGGDPVGQFYVKVTSGKYLRLNGVAIAKASTTASDPLPSSGISDGTYRVGYDIAAGWYQGTVNDHMGYWEVSSDANGQTLVANDYTMGPFTVKVKSGQYITLRGVTISQ